MFNLADESFQKNSKTHIATYYHIIVIYVFGFILFSYLFTLRISGCSGVFPLFCSSS